MTRAPRRIRDAIYARTLAVEARRRAFGELRAIAQELQSVGMTNKATRIRMATDRIVELHKVPLPEVPAWSPPEPEVKT